MRKRGMGKGAAARSGAGVRRPVGLGEEVYDALYAQLMSHAIRPGSRISIDSLARQLGVSQTPIRQALSRLEAQGLVVKTHLIGYSAAPQMDRAKLDQLFEMRLLLEPFAAEKAARTMKAGTLKTLRRLDAAMKDCMTDEVSMLEGRYAQLDREFHDLIADSSGNELVRDTLESLHTHVHLFRLFYNAGRWVHAVEEHRRIIDAFETGSPAKAKQAMKAHIEASKQRFLKFLDF